MHIAVTGGCGYIGSVLLPKLRARAKRIDVLDLVAPQPALARQMSAPQTEFHQMDVADPAKFKSVADRYDYIIHLAGLVGYPACDKNPELAVRYNVTSTQTVLENKRPGVGVFYASTCSNYGEQEGPVDENTPVKPTSWHGKTKARAEKLILQDPNGILYRFVSAFGQSPHTRNDLLIHDFVSQAVFGNTLSVYESSYIRQFVHVQDMTDAICFALDNWEKMKGQIYNIGHPENQLTKQDLVKEISRHVKFNYNFESTGSDQEKRNYPVQFDKITACGFQAKVGLSEGIAELVKYYRDTNVAQQANAVPTFLTG